MMHRSTTSRRIATSAKRSAPPRVERTVTFLPDPPGRGTQVHRHLGRRPHRRAARHVFEGRVPPEVRRSGAPGRREGGRQPDLALRRQRAPQRRVQRRRRPPRRGVADRAGPLRRDAPGRLGHRRADRATWTSTAIYASVNFPSFLPGFAGQRLQLVDQGRGAGPGHGPGVERLAPRGVGRDPPGSDHPVPDPVAARPRGRRGDDPRERRTRVQGGHLHRGPEPARPAVHPLRATGTRSSGPAQRPAR